MMLEITAADIGTTWVMHFDSAAVKPEFKVPESYESTALLIVGYPAPDTAPYLDHFECRPIEETVFCYEF